MKIRSTLKESEGERLTEYQDEEDDLKQNEFMKWKPEDKLMKP
jgi:hypothetical protein